MTKYDELQKELVLAELELIHVETMIRTHRYNILFKNGGLRDMFAMAEFDKERLDLITDILVLREKLQSLKDEIEVQELQWPERDPMDVYKDEVERKMTEE